MARRPMDGRDAADGLLPPASLYVCVFVPRAHLCMSSERELHTETVRAGGRRRAPDEWLGAARGLLCVRAEDVVRERVKDCTLLATCLSARPFILGLHCTIFAGSLSCVCHVL